MASFVFLLIVAERQSAEIATIPATSLAVVEWLFFLAMDMSTRMRRLSWFDYLDALQPLGHLRILGILECLVFAREYSFDRQWRRINLTYAWR